MIHIARITSKLDKKRYSVMVTAESPSTNAALKNMAAAGAPEGTTIVAERQSAGRGRLGHTFSSEAGGLYLSTLLRPSRLRDPGIITCCAAVAAARAIESRCDLTVDIKWVNDLYIGGRKVGGILAEGVFAPDGRLTAVVLGVGINVTNPLPAELSTLATTLAQEGVTLRREELAVAFLKEWEQVYTAPPGAAMWEYRRRNLVPGRQVTVVQGDITYTATAEAITPEGHLTVRTPEGTVHTLSSGEVSLRL